MNFLERIWTMAKEDKKLILLPEGEEERNIVAAEKIIKNDLANLILLGNEDKIKNKAKSLNVNIDGVKIINPETSEDIERYANEFYELRKHKGITIEKATSIVKDPLYYGTMMLKLGEVDGLTSGAIHTTSDLLRPGLQIVKTAPGVSIVSGFFAMIVPNREYGDNGLFLFADCGINPNPNSEELADIAISTAETAKKLCDMDPKVAMLSYSTYGSAKHELIDKVTKAVSIANEKRPDLAIDGELQLDAAIVEDVAKLKAPGSNVAGKANVLVFPDLQAGNIAYKSVQRFGNAKALGPLCQGFAKPINDLSRGCSADDIVDIVAITAVEAQKGI